MTSPPTTPSVLQVENLGRFYRDPLGGHWALRGVSFDLPPGTSVGITGPNGAGKSTLIRIISGVEAPTEGRAIGRGRLWSISSLRIGFTPESRIKDAVATHAAFRGIPKQEALAVLEEVFDWTELNVSIHHRLSQLSDGMADRLAFGVGVFLKPHLLVADGVLAVGDAAFRERCLDQIEVMVSEGMALLLASPKQSLLDRFCQGIIVLENGIIAHKETLASRYKSKPGFLTTITGSDDSGEGIAAENYRYAQYDQGADEDSFFEHAYECEGVVHISKRMGFVGDVLSIDLENGSELRSLSQGTSNTIRVNVTVAINWHKPFRLLADFTHGRHPAFRMVSPEYAPVKQQNRHFQLTIPLGLLNVGLWRCAIMIADGGGKSQIQRFDVDNDRSGHPSIGDWRGRMPGPVVPHVKWTLESMIIHTDLDQALVTNQNCAILQVFNFSEIQQNYTIAEQEAVFGVDFRLMQDTYQVRCCLDFARGRDRAFRIVMPHPQPLAIGIWRACAVLPANLFAEGFYDINVILVFPDPDGPPPLAAYGALRIQVVADLTTGTRKGWKGAMPGVVMPASEWHETTEGA